MCGRIVPVHSVHSVCVLLGECCVVCMKKGRMDMGIICVY